MNYKKFLFITAPFGLSVGLFNSYYGQAGDIKAQYPTANPEYSPFNFMTANVSLNINQLTGFDFPAKFSLNLYAENLLDAKIYYNVYEQRTINTIPGRGGRSFVGGLNVAF